MKGRGEKFVIKESEEKGNPNYSRSSVREEGKKIRVAKRDNAGKKKRKRDDALSSSPSRRKEEEGNKVPSYSPRKREGRESTPRKGGKEGRKRIYLSSFQSKKGGRGSSKLLRKKKGVVLRGERGSFSIPIQEEGKKNSDI